jgi:hypothetical protein
LCDFPTIACCKRREGALAGVVGADQGRESRHGYPDGSSMELHRNARGQLSGYGRALTLEYGGDGLETERHFSTGVKVTSDYDDDRRRTDLLVENAGRRGPGVAPPDLRQRGQSSRPARPP